MYKLCIIVCFFSKLCFNKMRGTYINNSQNHRHSYKSYFHYNEYYNDYTNNNNI